MGNHDSYSDSAEPVGWHQLYSGVGADIVHGINYTRPMKKDVKEKSISPPL